MTEQLGDGEEITSADAQRALYPPRNGRITNSRERINEYFNRLYGDGSGMLSVPELRRLLQHSVKHQDDQADPPRLPATWA